MKPLLITLLCLSFIACKKENEGIKVIPQCAPITYCSFITPSDGNQEIRAGLKDGERSLFFASDHLSSNFGLKLFEFEQGITKEERLELQNEFYPYGAAQNNSHYFLAGVTQVDNISRASILAINKSNLSFESLVVGEGTASRFNAITLQNDELVAVGWIRDSVEQNYLLSRISYDLSKSENWVMQKEGADALVAVEASSNQLFCLGHEYEGTNRDISILRFDDEQLKLRRVFGSMAYEEAQAMCLSADGNLIVAAHSAKLDPLHDAWCLKLDKEANIIWEKYIGGEAHDGCEAVLEGQNGDLLFVTRSESFSAASDVYVIKLNQEGELLEEEIISEEGINEAFVILEGENKYLLAGSRKIPETGEQDAHFVYLAP